MEVRDAPAALGTGRGGRAGQVAPLPARSRPLLPTSLSRSEGKLEGGRESAPFPSGIGALRDATPSDQLPGRARQRPSGLSLTSSFPPLPRLAAPISFQVLLSLRTDRAGAPPSPARGRLDMLPKVETEALGLIRSNGERGHMPENMQGKGREDRRAPG